VPNLVADCPRCGAKSITFDVHGAIIDSHRHSWVTVYEAFCACRRCHKSTTFVTAMKNEAYGSRGALGDPKQILSLDICLNQYFEIERHVSLRDQVTTKAPDFLSKELDNAFSEGAACFAIGCYNAAGTMFRLCVDLATRPLLPVGADGVGGEPSRKVRRDLGLRLPWLITNGHIPSTLAGLAACVREDGNDGAHQGSLSKADVEDLIDFTYALLERLVTEPERLRRAEQRREERRASTPARAFSDHVASYPAATR
jgi:hypothetical protein